MSMQYSPFYMFLSYLQIGTMILTFVLAVIGVIAGILAIRALLIYIRNNKPSGSRTVSAAGTACEQAAFEAASAEKKEDDVAPELPSQNEAEPCGAETNEAAHEETPEA